jgi:aryl-alcohol dehydrogenase-like predicted oxidoreductase
VKESEKSKDFVQFVQRKFQNFDVSEFYGLDKTEEILFA